VREPNPRVARCALDDGASRSQLTPFFGILDNVERGAIFDAAAGVLELGFAEDFAAGFVR